MLKMILEREKVKFSVIISDKKKDKSKHRIEYLAQVREEALNPLRTSDIIYAKILFMNDVFFCKDDIIELLYQSYIQNADLTCGLDFDVNEGRLGFYDTWVARDINGRQFNKFSLDVLSSDAISNRNLKNGDAFQVHCCWNGVAVLNASPFYKPHNVKFRRGNSKVLSKVQSSDLNLIVHGKWEPETRIFVECSGSEISQLCVDFHKNGFHNMIVVPRVRFAYKWQNYVTMKNHYTGYSNAQSNALIEYRKLSKSVFCQPMEKSGVTSPKGIPGELIIRYSK
jgi:hypothetical protein